MEDGGRLAPMIAELVDRLAISVIVRRFPSMGVANSRSLRIGIYVRMQHSVRRTTYMFLFGVFGGICGENSWNVFLMLFMVLWVPISVTLFRRALLMLWLAFLFLGLCFSLFYILFT
jgi:hypothetical protein